MMTNNQSWAEVVSNLRKDESFESEVAQIRAKALLKDISTEPPSARWTYIPSRIIRNITAASFSLEFLAESDPDKLFEYEKDIKEFALVWESLAKLGERTNINNALMNAAVAYELAGYQANAVCLARRLTPALSVVREPDIHELISVFLQRLFLQVRLFVDRLSKEPEVENITIARLPFVVARALAEQSLFQASKFFLSGDRDALTNARNLLLKSEQVFTQYGFVAESNLVRNIRILLPVMERRSTWSNFRDLVNVNSRWRRYLKLLARGVGVNPLSSSSISELWPSQIHALDKGLLDTKSSKVIKMPTSAGKTRIAELAMVNTLVTIPNAKCVYIAPYRALVWELEQAFLDLFGDLGFKVSSVIGTYESDSFEQMLVDDADILVMTPEKLDLIQRAKPEFLNNVRLFVLDEGQIVHDQNRGVKFEILLTRLKRKLPNARFLFISAVVPQETLEDFVQWFNSDPQRDIMSFGWRPSIQRVAKFAWSGENGVIRYSPDEDIQLLRQFVPGVIRQRTFTYMNPSTGRTNRILFPDPQTKSQVAAELAFKFSGLGPVLVFCSQPSFVEAVAKALERRLDLLSKTGETIPNHFLNKSSTRSVLSAQEWLGTDHPTTGFLMKGIAVHHGRLPDILRKSVELDFRSGNYNVLIATNTLAQGVNLPIRTVIVHSCWRHGPRGRERIPARDYWNIAGRAGRAGRETEGTIIHIVTEQSDERDYEYYLRHRNMVEPVHGALFRLLVDLVHERLSEEAIDEALDPEILALLVEEGADFLSEVNIETFLRGSLVEKQATRNGYDTRMIQKSFKKVANHIMECVPDRSYWPVYSSTGLNSASCERIRKYISERKSRLNELLRDAGPSQKNALVELFLDCCLSLPEMKAEQELGVSSHQLLESWLDGKSIPEIRSEFNDQITSLEELARFIEDLFEFRLPWGISAFIRIAMKELNLQTDDVSNYVKFFPTMVKYGVPTPEASWALSAGISFRKTGIDMAARYLAESESPSFNEFNSWLGKLNSEDLRFEFGLKSPALEDISKSLSRSTSNPLLKKYASSDDVLPLDTYVRGISYENRFITALKAREGQPVFLERDYDNLVDRNAIEVLLEGQPIGYVERQLAQVLAPDLDCGAILKGTIKKIEKARIPQVMIRIEKVSSVQ